MTQGFFEKTEFTSTKKSMGTMTECGKCGLHKTSLNPRLSYFGKGKKKILIIQESPKTHTKFLHNIFNKYGIDLFKDCWIISSVNCTTDKEPSLSEISCCRPKVLKTIKELKPKKIIVLGNSPLNSILAHRMNDLGGIIRFAGYAIPDKELGAWIFPTFDPEFVINSDKNKAVELLFKRHIRKAIKHNDKFPIQGNEKDKVKILNKEETIYFLNKILDDHINTIVFDYETSGLKPDKPEHYIKCMSISVAYNSARAFLFYGEDKEFLKLWKKILRSHKIKKIAHNLKHEHRWTKTLLEYDIINWAEDTMIMAHSSDNREKITSLEFQTYINYGISDFKNDTKQYLEITDEDGFNNIGKAPIEKLLMRNAFDSMYTMNLAIDNRIKNLNQLIEAHDLFLQGQINFAQIEQNGIHTNIEHYELEKCLLERRIKRLKTKIKESKEFKLYRKKTGKSLNINSNDELGKLFFTYLKYTPKLFTPTGKPSTSAIALEAIQEDSPIISAMLEVRKKEKIISTYINNFIAQSVDGVMRPNFNLNFVTSYRSSSSDPNFQNIPKRDKEAQRICRGGIIPRKGNRIVGIDYSQIEIRIAACVTRDRNLIKYVTDPTTDMHRDSSLDIFVLKKSQMVKEIRQEVKNKFVFPEFYNDYYGNIAPKLWEFAHVQPIKDGTLLIDHLSYKNLGSYKKFEKHVQKAEDILWNKRFPDYNQWRWNIWDFYQKKGYIELVTGFRAYYGTRGVLDKKQCNNIPIQGPAYHCLQWSINQLQPYAKRNWKKSFIIGQIHDDMVSDFYDDEWHKNKQLIREVMTERIREHWKWITVPLDIEAEATEINGDWYEKHKIEI